jgi:hypothetical protein
LKIREEILSRNHQFSFSDEKCRVYFSDQVFIFLPDYFSSLDGRILTMKILVKKSLAEKNYSHLASFFRSQLCINKKNGIAATPVHIFSRSIMLIKAWQVQFVYEKK